VFQGIGGFGSEAGMMGHGMMGHVHAAAPQHQDPAVPPGSAIAAPLLAEAETLSPEAMAEQATLAPSETLVSTVYGLGAPEGLATQTNSDLVVNVTGMQFAWIFEYPDQGITSGELHIPLGKRVQLKMKAVDVIHAFWVPQFRLKQDVMPGLDSELQFVATKTGTFPVFCAELCGSYHGAMRTITVVHSPEEFDTWVQDSQIAQQESPQTIAMNLREMSDTEFLAPYAQDIGLSTEAIAQLQQMSSQRTLHSE
jgi:cytochrome c oxidase subunit 2